MLVTPDSGGPHPRHRGPSARSNPKSRQSAARIWDIVTDSRIIDVVADLLRDSVILRHSHLFTKLPGDAKRVAWHQDASYWPLSPSRVVTAWLAIDPCQRRLLSR